MMIFSVWAIYQPSFYKSYVSFSLEGVKLFRLWCQKYDLVIAGGPAGFYESLVSQISDKKSAFQAWIDCNEQEMLKYWQGQSGQH